MNRKTAVLEELAECETIQEVDAIVRDLQESEPGLASDSDVIEAGKRRVADLTVQGPETMAALKLQIETLQLQLKQVDKGKVERAPVIRSGRSYKLLKTDVSWSTKPQVTALMEILTAHMQVDEVRSEAEIVEMMVANEHVLQTRQGGKRIWDYYKGDHNLGLMAHGNIKRV